MCQVKSFDVLTWKVIIGQGCRGAEPPEHAHDLALPSPVLTGKDGKSGRKSERQRRFSWETNARWLCYNLRHIPITCAEGVVLMAQPKTHEVTTLLQAWGRGEDAALDEIIPIVYRELRRIAHRYMAGERPDHTLQTTALVNEAYLKLVDSRRVNWRNRAHFFAISAQLMRRILVDYARSRGYQKRGGGARTLLCTTSWWALTSEGETCWS